MRPSGLVAVDRLAIRRRGFLTGIAATAIWPMAACAQPARAMRRVIVMTNVTESDRDEQTRLTAFRQELQQRGWLENNLQLDLRWTGASLELARTLSAEIVGMKPDVIFVAGTTTVSTMLQHTRSIPVVFVTGADPVQVGFVKSLARPGGNATGFADFEDAMGTKWLELLKEIAPMMERVIFLHSDSRASLIQLPALKTVAAAIGVELIPANVRNGEGIANALDAYAGAAPLSIGMIVAPSAILAVHRNVTIARAAKHAFPAIYANRRYSADGGLISYGVDRVEQYRRAASYVDRILKGAKPADLPTQLPTKFEMVVNLKTAKAIGLTIPTSVLVRADEIIE